MSEESAVSADSDSRTEIPKVPSRPIVPRRPARSTRGHDISTVSSESRLDLGQGHPVPVVPRRPLKSASTPVLTESTSETSFNSTTEGNRVYQAGVNLPLHIEEEEDEITKKHVLHNLPVIPQIPEDNESHTPVTTNNTSLPIVEPTDRTSLSNTSSNISASPELGSAKSEHTNSDSHPNNDVSIPGPSVPSRPSKRPSRSSPSKGGQSEDGHSSYEEAPTSSELHNTLDLKLEYENPNVEGDVSGAQISNKEVDSTTVPKHPIVPHRPAKRPSRSASPSKSRLKDDLPGNIRSSEFQPPLDTVKSLNAPLTSDTGGESAVPQQSIQIATVEPTSPSRIASPVKNVSNLKKEEINTVSKLDAPVIPRRPSRSRSPTRQNSGSSASHIEEASTSTPSSAPGKPKSHEKAGLSHTLTESENVASDDSAKIKRGPPKVPPKRPAKLSSKIAMFQQSLFNSSADDLQRKPKPSVPHRPKRTIKKSADSGSSSLETDEDLNDTPIDRGTKLNVNRSKFAKNLEGMFGRSPIGLPGMMPMPGMTLPASASPSDDVTKEEDSDKKEEPKVEKIVLSDARRGRVRGPRGRKLPSEVLRPVAKDPIQKLSLASFDVWSYGKAKKEPEVEDTDKETEVTNSVDGVDKSEDVVHEAPKVQSNEDEVERKKSTTSITKSIASDHITDEEGLETSKPNDEVVESNSLAKRGSDISEISVGKGIKPEQLDVKNDSTGTISEIDDENPTDMNSKTETLIEDEDSIVTTTHVKDKEIIDSNDQKINTLSDAEIDLEVKADSNKPNHADSDEEFDFEKAISVEISKEGGPVQQTKEISSVEEVDTEINDTRAETDSTVNKQ